MKILIIGSGGREHALAWRIAQSPRAQTVYVAPGNGGTSQLNSGQIKNLPITNPLELAEFAQHEGIHLTVVGPEIPLAGGIVNYFRDQNLKIFGPTREAAQLESSKTFAKEFMQRHNIPTAAYQVFSDAQAACTYVTQQNFPLVIKADGLAAGKGVVIASDRDQAIAAINMMLIDNKMGDAGARIVIEDFLQGEEVSFIVMVDGKNVLPLASSQDHKRLLDGDQGPNTGGMGAYSPAPLVTPMMHARIMREIILPTVLGLAQEGMRYTGFLYAGLMIDGEGNPKTLEFNCRLGDPETQPMMMRLKSDFLTVIEQAITGDLNTVELEWDRRCALGVVLAAPGYPDAPRKGDVITGLPSLHSELDDCFVFHAGTANQQDQIVTAGGRVLCVTALGDNIKLAQKRAYETVDKIHFNGMQYRHDIGWRAVQKRSVS